MRTLVIRRKSEGNFALFDFCEHDEHRFVPSAWTIACMCWAQRCRGVTNPWRKIREANCTSSTTMPLSSPLLLSFILCQCGGPVVSSKHCPSIFCKQYRLSRWRRLPIEQCLQHDLRNHICRWLLGNPAANKSVIHSPQRFPVNHASKLAVVIVLISRISPHVAEVLTNLRSSKFSRFSASNVVLRARLNDCNCCDGRQCKISRQEFPPHKPACNKAPSRLSNVMRGFLVQ